MRLVILVVLLTSVLGCSTAPTGQRMLSTRADYEGPLLMENLGLKEAGIDGFRNSPVPIRTRAQVATVRIHAHELEDHSYFWGGWVSIVVAQDQWVLTKPGSLPKSPAFLDFDASSEKKNKSKGSSKK